MRELPLPHHYQIPLVNSGELRFYPSQWINNFNAWMNELRDWCISRQLWWGHRIPVFYCDCCDIKKASENDTEFCPKCGLLMRQDEDVLDTWFSSGLWAFSTLGWGNIKDAQSNHCADSSNEKLMYNENDLTEFYPNDLLITSFDILFFWVARMLFSGENFMHKLPFRDVYLHALVCDENGQKMSKSRGNVINPIELINAHNADILRFSLAYYCIQGRDIKIGEKSLEVGNTLFLKVLNALNFIMMYKEQQGGEFVEFEDISSLLGLYMQRRFFECVYEVRSALDNYRFNDAAVVIYKFLINDFCDWGIEFVKSCKEGVFELGMIFRESMKLLHPFMPFLSEYVYQTINSTTLEDSSSIMITKFPEFREMEVGNDFEIIKDIITTIRRAKVMIDFANKTIPLSYVKLNKSADLGLLNTFVPKLAKCTTIEIVESKVESCVFDIGEFCEIYIPMQNINLEDIKSKLHKKRQKILAEIIKLESMLNNENFVKNAPSSLVESNSKALSEANGKLEVVDRELSVLEAL